MIEGDTGTHKIWPYPEESGVTVSCLKKKYHETTTNQALFPGGGIVAGEEQRTVDPYRNAKERREHKLQVIWGEGEVKIKATGTSRGKMREDCLRYWPGIGGDKS